ncbi:MAG: N,N'-diacetylchitobiose phosphorylase [Defluviitaleaceae bacterium]|nr:N,N'-diacetylchitobiose phosphorylase [Defluviitaleaceae bacterium]
MTYGHFDLQNKEYVITKPNTPAPWANYLGSPAYGAIITNNAGGYSFVKSGAHGRLLRYRFNENDRPGRYVYLRDESGDFWSASWQPVGKPLDVYKSECRHGMGYTEISAEYKNIASNVKYYVPQGAEYEVWNVTVTNNDTVPREISAYGYAEFTCDGNYEQDQVNLQYSQFITKTAFKDPFIFQTITENMALFRGYNPVVRFFGLAGAKVAAYCGDKASFLGRYRDYGNPIGVENPKLCGTLNYNTNSCGAIQTILKLAPGESKSFSFILGQQYGLDAQDASNLLSRYDNPKSVTEEIAVLKNYWHGKLENLQVDTPNEHFNNMLNSWHSYQCFITFIWSRAASLSYCGLRNGYGYRDTVQDIQGIIHLDPDAALEKIKFMLSAQVHHGGGLPLVKFTHNPGHEDKPEDASYREATGHPSYRADDMMWMYPTVWKYIAETGNIGLLDEVVPYADKGEDTVYKHLLKAIDFTLNNLGIHDLPAGLHADWNDALRMGEKGVSAFVALQFYYAFEIMSRFASQRGDGKVESDMGELKARFGKIIEEKCWDTDRFVRGVAEDGNVIGKPSDPEANLWLNPQTWAVLSGYADEERGKAVLDLVYRELNTKYGARVMSPSYVKHAFDGALALLFNPSTKENASIFLQTQGWLILAESLLGRGERALEYYLESCPAAQNDIADIRMMEPYAYSQFTESVDSPFEGRSHVHWLTGTASTVMVGCVEGILGLRPDLGGLNICPAIPSDWKEFSMRKVFRGKVLNISVKNPDGKQSGCRKLTLNGTVMIGEYIPADSLQAENEVIVEM